MKERQLFLTSVLATTLAFSTYKMYTKDGKIDQEAVKSFSELVASSFEGAEKLIIKNPENPVNKCDCNGAKIIVHGDGHRTPCPCTGTSSGCQCGKSQASIPIEKKTVKFFTRPDCVNCTKWKGEQKERFKNSGWDIEEGYGAGLVPFFEFVKGDKKVVKVGYTSLEEAEKMINE
jgi:hypothetical protein